MYRITTVKQPAVVAAIVVAFTLSAATILPAAEITVTSPNGGETWQANTSQTITWTTPNPAGSVLVELYRYTGGTYQFAYYLGWAPASAGTFTCTVPKYECDGGDYVVGLSWYDDDSWVIDYSDAVLSIANSLPLPAISVTSPQSGADWPGGSIQNITWTGTADGNVNVVLARLVEGSYMSLSNLASLPASDGSFAWTIPTTLTDASNYAILIHWRDGSVTANYYSDGTFHIDGTPPPTPPSVTITSPNGGEVWSIGSTHSVTWSTDATQGSYRIELFHQYEDGTFGWVADLGTAVLSAGTHACVVPESAENGEDYIVSFYSLEADSENTFQITGSLTVTSPNGGETWQAGTTETVTWTSASTTGNVDISLYRLVAGGYEWVMELGTSPVTDGTRDCTIPSDIAAGSNYVIRLCWSNAGTSSEDESDAVFQINNPSPIKLTYPVGGEIWDGGTTQTITWTSTNPVGNVDVWLTTRQHPESVQHLGAAAMSSGSFDWQIPSCIPNAAGLSFIVKLSYDQGTRWVQPQPEFRILAAIPADYNADCLVDSEDLASFVECATGPSVTYNPSLLPAGCTLSPVNGILPADFDGDMDVDSDDYAAFQRYYTGPSN